MTVKLNMALRSAMADTIASSLGAAGTVLNIYSGTQPATANSAPTGVLLASITLDCGWLGNGQGGLSLSGTVTPSVALATGTAGWGRLTEASTYAMDGTVGVSGTDFIVNTVSVTSGAAVNVTAININLPTA